MLALDDEPAETDVHFEHAILDRILRRATADRIEHAWPDEEPTVLRADEHATWEALHQAMRRLRRD